MKIEMIGVNKIKPDPSNPRKGMIDQEDLKNMASTFKHHSIIQPIEIDENNQIIVGELRWRAAKIADLKEIPCRRLTNLSPTKRLERQLIENLHHQKVDLGECIDELKLLLNSVCRVPDRREPKYNADQGINMLAGRLGVDRRWLGEILQIDKAPPKIKKEVDKWYQTKEQPITKRKGISASQAIEVIKAPKIIQDDLLDRAKEGITSKKIRDLRVKYKQDAVSLQEIRKFNKPLGKLERTVRPLNFRKKHIEMIKNGTKMQTSRMWTDIRIGDIVPIHLHEPDIARVKIIDNNEKRLGDFTEEDAKNEGNYSLDEFKEVWKKIHGEWNPNQEVKILKFKMVENDN